MDPWPPCWCFLSLTPVTFLPWQFLMFFSFHSYFLAMCALLYFQDRKSVWTFETCSPIHVASHQTLCEFLFFYSDVSFYFYLAFLPFTSKGYTSWAFHRHPLDLLAHVSRHTVYPEPRSPWGRQVNRRAMCTPGPALTEKLLLYSQNSVCSFYWNGIPCIQELFTKNGDGLN